MEKKKEYGVFKEAIIKNLHFIIPLCAALILTFLGAIFIKIIAPTEIIMIFASITLGGVVGLVTSMLCSNNSITYKLMNHLERK